MADNRLKQCVKNLQELLFDMNISVIDIKTLDTLHIGDDITSIRHLVDQIDMIIMKEEQKGREE